VHDPFDCGLESEHPTLRLQRRQDEMTGFVVDSGWASDTCDKGPGEDARSSTRNLQACVSGE